MKTRLNKEKERFLLALHKGIDKTKALKADLKLTHKKYQTVVGFLLKHKYIERLERGFYRLLPKGGGYVTVTLEPSLVLAFENSQVQTFLRQFPEPYQGILRLTLACCVAKKTKLFKAFGAGFPATLLIGEAGIGKSPIGDTLSWLQGKDPLDVKIDARLLSKGELGGRLERDLNHKGKWRLSRSYWQKQDWAQIEEVEKVISRDVSGLIKVIAHAEKSFIREGEKIPNLVVPFMTMNIEGKQGQAALDKIDKHMGIPFIKRNNILFCNPYKGYLDDPSKFFRQVLSETPNKKVPTLTLNVPILQTALNESQFDLLAKLIKNGMLPNIDNSHCDKRGVGIEVLAYHALAGNKDIISATYQIVKDRLQCLESLGLVRDGWRDEYNKGWLDYEAVANPNRAEEIEEAIKRQEDLIKSIPVIDIPKDIHNGTVDLAKRHSEMLDKLRVLRDCLEFPITNIKGIKESKLPTSRIEEVCRRYKRNNKGLKNNIQIEITTLKKVTEDNIRIGDLMIDDFREKERLIKVAFGSDLQGIRNTWLQGLSDKELKAEIVREIQGLIKELWKADLWASTNNTFVRNAIKNLREKSGKLRSHLHTVLKNKKVSSLYELKGELRNARLKSNDWFREFEEDSKDLGIEMVSGVIKAGYDVVIGITNIFKGKGGGKGGKQSPTEPKSPTGYGGRSLDDI